MARWSESVLALVEGRESKVVTLHAPDKLAGRPTHERRNGPDQSHEWTMAAAEAEDTLQWVSLHEEAVRLAERYTGELKPLAAYAVEQRFRNGGYRYRYRDDGVLQANDLSDEFLRAAVIDVAGSTATRPARVERVPNPNLPYARGDCPTPQVQWAPRGSYPFPPRDPFLRPAHIEKTVPAKTVTDIEVLVLRLSEPPVVEKVAQTAPRPGRPSSAPLVLKEAGRRLLGSESARHIQRGREHFLAGLSDWLRDTQPKAPPMAPKTIGDHLREDANVRALLPESWFRQK